MKDKNRNKNFGNYNCKNYEILFTKRLICDKIH